MSEDIFGCYKQGRKDYYWHVVGRGMLLNILQCTGQLLLPPPKELFGVNY